MHSLSPVARRVTPPGSSRVVRPSQKRLVPREAIRGIKRAEKQTQVRMGGKPWRLGERRSALRITAGEEFYNWRGKRGSRIRRTDYIEGIARGLTESRIAMRSHCPEVTV